MEIVLKGFVGYLPVLVSVVTAPKPSILKLITDTPNRANKAFIFCGISIAIGFIIQAPLLKSGQDIVTVGGSLLALKIFAIVTFAGIITMGFRLVGGKGDFNTTLYAGLYIVSPIYLFLVLTHIIGIGIVSTHDPALAEIWRAGQFAKNEVVEGFIRSAPYSTVGLLGLRLFQFLASMVWFLICWGTYRVVHQVTPARSALVYLVVTIMWYLYWIVTMLIVKGLFRGELSPII